MRATKAFLIGAGTAYLFDPRQGRRRRHVLRDRALRVSRRFQRQSIRKARFVRGHMLGISALLRRLLSDRRVAVDDATVAQRIRSSTLRNVGVSTRDVEVEVERGVATLRGSVPSRELSDDLVSRVSKVPGVQEVAAMLRISADDELR